MYLLTKHSFNFHIHFHFLVFMVAYFVALRQNLNHVKGSRAIVFISLSFLLILDFLLHFYISTAFYNHFHNQVKSEPCRAPGAIICPQHFTLCGGDTCIDRWGAYMPIWGHVQLHRLASWYLIYRFLGQVKEWVYFSKFQSN